MSFRIEGELTIYRAAELKDTLLAAVAANDTLEVDLSAVEEFDTAGVQLLMLAKRAAGTAGHTLRLTGHSAPVLDVFELLDLSQHFGDPIVLPA
ncbi:MAG: STAS domain-containing protein [Rhizobacter sp.]